MDAPIFKFVVKKILLCVHFAFSELPLLGYQWGVFMPKIIRIAGLALALTGCPSQKPQEAHILEIAESPSITVDPDNQKAVSAKAHSNSGNAISYVWESVFKETNKDVSQSKEMLIRGSQKSQCGSNVEGYRLIATSGSLRSARSFLLESDCTRGGVKINEASDVIVTPKDALWLAPGQKVTLLAQSSSKDKSLSWSLLQNGSLEPVSTNTSFDFVAPELDYPCQIKDILLAAVSTSSDGTNQFKTVSLHVQNPKCTLLSKDGLSHVAVTKLLVASDDSLYIGTQNGLSRYQNGSIEKVESPRRDNPIFIVTALAEVVNQANPGQSTILIGKARKVPPIPFTIGFGLERISRRENFDFWENTTVTPKKFITALSVSQKENPFPVLLFAEHFQDRSGGGILFSSDTSFSSTSAILNGENIYTVLEVGDEQLFGGDGGLFVINKNKLVERFDGRQWNSKGGPFGIGSNRNVRALARDNNGTVWVGLEEGWSFQPGGLVSFEPQRDSLRSGKWSEVIRLPKGNDVRALAVDGESNLWIATNNGLTKRNPNGSFTVYDTKDGLPSADISDVVYDPETGNLWIGTSAGVARWGLLN